MNKSDNIKKIEEYVAYSAHFIFENAVDFHKKLHHLSKYDFTKFKYKLEYINNIPIKDDFSYLANLIVTAINESDDIEFKMAYNRGYDLFLMCVIKSSTKDVIVRDFIKAEFEFNSNGFTPILTEILKTCWDEFVSYSKENGPIVTECNGNNMMRDNWDPVNGSSDTPVL